jgi:hypothetical protein
MRASEPSRVRARRRLIQPKGRSSPPPKMLGLAKANSRVCLWRQASVVGNCRGAPIVQAHNDVARRRPPFRIRLTERNYSAFNRSNVALGLRRENDKHDCEHNTDADQHARAVEIAPERCPVRFANGRPHPLVVGSSLIAQLAPQPSTAQALIRRFAPPSPAQREKER